MENLEMSLFDNVYKGKKVLVTGNTGFKGSWLSFWLHQLGAKVVGFADKIPTEPSFFKATGLDKIIHQHWGDIKDVVAINHVVEKTKPDFIFHLAAQSLVKKSFHEPLDTFSTNGMGTAHLLMALKNIQHPCTAVIITSDKCYENVEWVWGYKETDRLGGKDPYSASKAMAEIVFHSLFHSYFTDHPFVKLATARAGNVIGGGDWADDRIVPDCIRSWSQKKTVEIRRPESTRPWQHVLEPLSGYLLLGSLLNTNRKINGQSYNFGPHANQNHTVRELIHELSVHWSVSEPQIRINEHRSFYEAGLLKLNTDKALFELKWQPTLNFEQTMKLTGEWYDFYYKNQDTGPVRSFSLSQLKEYIRLASQKKASWIVESAG